MIIYFSGTGNSRYVAEALAKQLNERCISIEQTTPSLAVQPGESIGLVFPVYAWGVPHIFETFIRQRLVEIVGTAPDAKKQYLWSVITCGDDIGFADRFLNKELLSAIGRKADAIFSVQMTETYVCLPGFDVDPRELAETKVSRADQTLTDFAEEIRQQRSVLRVRRGPIPYTYTYVLRPFFNRWLMTDRYFHADAARCTGCGKCAKECPTGDIQLTDGMPHWQGKDCTTCLRCFHHCPARAIDWGKYTKGKKQKPLP